MSLYYIKPIVWNTNGYQRPSGVSFNSGYPKEHGFGHEEWNNSSLLAIEENGEKFRVFHTEGLGNQPIDDYPEDIFIFMIAAHDGGQYLVGVAGGATGLFSDQNREERERLVTKHRLGGARGRERWREAWAVQNVKNCYGNDKTTFRRFWNDELHWTPTWKCPANLFLWLENPILLSPEKISGKKKLIVMYGSYQQIDRSISLCILNSINQPNDAEIIENLKALGAGGLDLITDIRIVQNDPAINRTTKETLIQARIGQGKFRKQLMQIWDNRCAATGCAVPQLLKASHILPWRHSSNKQRLDPNNGLLLIANLDALFDDANSDSVLISFEDSGEMLISESVSNEERTRLGIPQRLRQALNKSQAKYLSHHRKKLK
jgi:hypothetical protein